MSKKKRQYVVIYALPDNGLVDQPSGAKIVDAGNAQDAINAVILEAHRELDPTQAGEFDSERTKWLVLSGKDMKHHKINE